MSIVKEEHKDKYIRWFSELGSKDVKLVGGKAANLGEMSSIEMPVPPGFAITSEAYSYFLEKTGLGKEIYKILGKLDVDDTEELEKITNKIKEMVKKEELPEDLKDEILEAYESLSVDKETMKNASSIASSILKLSEPSFVAVRSSATAEDSAEASFAGQQDTFLNVKGKENLIEKVKACFASLFTARSVFYRVKKGFKHEKVLNAVVVQKMINSDKSGVIFSKSPIGNKEDIIVESVFGLGEGIVSGKIEPDNHSISKDLEILSEKIAEKKIALTRDSSGETKTVKLTEEKANQKVLSDYEIKKLADYAIKLEEHYGIPQDIEFAIESDEIFIVQTRPITTLKEGGAPKGVPELGKEEIEGEVILSGMPASPGVGTGEVKVITDLKDLSKIKKGDVLVTEMTNPDMVVTMQKCSAIVTDEGGMTAHASIVSREMGIPAIVGTKKATSTLKDGEFVTVDGTHGKVYAGKIEELKAGKVEILPIVETKTKIKVIVDLPSFAERAAKTKCSSVGLTRLEGIIAESGKHPMGFLKAGEINKYEDIIFKGIKKISEYFKEIWIRTSDIRTDEYKNLEGAPKEPEPNPMLGMHGIRAGLKYPKILKAELKAMKKIAESGIKIGILSPQIVSVEEVKKLKEILKEIGGEKIKLGIMIETPASVEIIEDLCKEGIDFISFGTNDLTQYTLAIDRGNEEVQYLHDEMHPAILHQLDYVLEVCKKYNVETSICGQAGSKKEMAKFLVERGVDSISVNADKAKEISEYVRELEDKNTGENKQEDKKIDNQPKQEKPATKKQLHDVKCSECGIDTQVPFKPDGKRPVYCKECFKNRQRKNAPIQKPVENKEVKTTPINEETSTPFEKQIGQEIEKTIEKNVGMIQETEPTEQEIKEELQEFERMQEENPNQNEDVLDIF